MSPMVAEGLRRAGYDAVHVRQYGMAAASDSEILLWAAAESRVVGATDTDFGTLLALSQGLAPSVVTFRAEWSAVPPGS